VSPERILQIVEQHLGAPREPTAPPRAKHRVCVCVGTSCWVRRSGRVLEQLGKRLGAGAGQTSADGEVAVEASACLGACALGPVVVVDGEVRGGVQPGRVHDIVLAARGARVEPEPVSRPALFGMQVSCPRCNRGLMGPERPPGGRPSVRLLYELGSQRGRIGLSGLYGSFEIASEPPVPPGTVVTFVCHRCHAELRATHECPRCGAPMAPLHVRGGGVLHLCSRLGCGEHMLHVAGDNVD
jgi:(2Fe-2S) ferredoxin